MNDKQILELIYDEDVLLEYMGNLFEYIGKKSCYFVFQDINDVSHSLSVTYEELLNSSRYQLVRYADSSTLRGLK